MWPCGGTIKINDLEDSSVKPLCPWVTNELQKTLALSLIMSKSAWYSAQQAATIWLSWETLDAAGPSDRFAKVKLPYYAPSAVMLIRCQLKKPQGPVTLLEVTHLICRIRSAGRGWAFAGRGPWAMFLENVFWLRDTNSKKISYAKS